MRYTKSEERIINNTIKMVSEVKSYHERTQSWDIPEHMIVDGCKVGKWWIEINKRVREGAVPDEVVHILIEEKVDCGIEPLYQEEWYEMSKKWKREHDGRITKKAHVGQYNLEAWYNYFLSYRSKESRWLSQFEKFSPIWTGDKPFSGDTRIGSKSVCDWALAQINDKNLSFWKEDMLDEIGFIWNEQKLLSVLTKRIVRKFDGIDSKRLQQYIDTADPAGITFIDVYGFVAENKGDIPWSGNGFFRCEVGINSIFSKEQFTQYVKKMQKEIAKRSKEAFIRFSQNSGVTLTNDDIKIHRMVANKSSHRITILIKVTKVIEMEVEESEEMDEMDEAG